MDLDSTDSKKKAGLDYNSARWVFRQCEATWQNVSDMHFMQNLNKSYFRDLGYVPHTATIKKEKTAGCRKL